MPKIVTSLQSDHKRRYLSLLCSYSLYLENPFEASLHISYTPFKTSHGPPIFLVKHSVTPYKLSYLALYVFTLLLHYCNPSACYTVSIFISSFLSGF